MIHPINIQAGMVNKHVRLAPPVNALKIEGAEANAHPSRAIRACTAATNECIFSTQHAAP